MTAFACNRCGACCRLVGTQPETVSLDRGDGVCRHLTNGNECSIYDSRPAICRVDESCPQVMALAEWHRRNHDACTVLRLRVYGQEA